MLINATSFVRLVSHDTSYESDLLQELNLAHNFFHFLDRLIAKGYDLCAHKVLSGDAPVHRTWRLFMNQTCMGFLSDAPGQLCTLAWQPAEMELESPIMTLTLYSFDDHVNLHWEMFLKVFKCTSLEQARSMLEGKYMLVPSMW